MKNSTKNAATMQTVAGKTETLEQAREKAAKLRAEGYGTRIVDRPGFFLVYRTLDRFDY